MTTIASEANYADWLAQCKELAGERWHEFTAWYSFHQAYGERMTPAKAVEDCRAWLDEQ